LSFYRKRGGLEGVKTIEDGVSYHTSTYTMKYRLLNGIKRMDWPPHSPDLNLIEKVWAMFKYRYRRSVWKKKRIPRNEQELIALAQEVWEALPWDRIYKYIDSMPERIVTCIRRNGGSTQW
jgi:transposase